MDLGATGWVRVDLGESSDLLGYVFLPSGLFEFDEIIFLSRPAPHVVAVWREIAHPNSVLRANLSGNRGLAELALASQARHVLVLGTKGSMAVVETRDAVAAQLLASAWDFVHHEQRGVESEGPWERIETQSLISIGAGITLPSQLNLTVRADDAVSRSRVERIVEVLGCQVRWETSIIATSEH